MSRTWTLEEIDRVIEEMSPGVKRALVALRDNQPGAMFGPCVSVLRARKLVRSAEGGEPELSTLGRRVAMRIGGLP